MNEHYLLSKYIRKKGVCVLLCFIVLSPKRKVSWKERLRDSCSDERDGKEDETQTSPALTRAEEGKILAFHDLFHDSLKPP